MSLHYPTFVITTEPAGPGREKCERHFDERGIGPRTYFHAVHGERQGLTTTQPYNLDHPGSGWIMGPRPLGCWLAHRMLWAALQMRGDAPDAGYTVLEQDALFPADWQGYHDGVLRDLPADWDVVYLGSCCCEHRKKGLVKGNVYEVHYPLCTHAMLLRARALPVLIDTQDNCQSPMGDAKGFYAPIDISLTLHSLPKLRVYTVLPRMVHQHDTVIPP